MTEENDLWEIFSVAEVATLFRVSAQTVTGWCRTGQIEAFRAGANGHWRISRQAINDFRETRMGVKK